MNHHHGGAAPSSSTEDPNARRTHTDLCKICIRILDPLAQLKFSEKHKFHYSCLHHWLIPRKSSGKYSSLLMNDYSNTCASCLDPLLESGKQVKSNCGHTFHKECHRQWLMRKRKCPACQHPMAPWDDVHGRCVTCLQTLTDASIIFINNCGHSFHGKHFFPDDSIHKSNKKISIHKRCPICKYPIGQPYLTASCVVCFEQFTENCVKVQDPCGHQYHMECHQHWLTKKKKCPLCSRSAMSVDFSNKCVVCLDAFTENSAIVQNDCAHKFHPDCHDQWMVKHKTCPICKYPLAPWSDIRDKCIVCLDPLTAAGNEGALNCGHKMHPSCKNQWLVNNTTCPICKYPIAPWNNIINKCVVCMDTFNLASEGVNNTCGHKFHLDCKDMRIIQKKNCPVCKARIFSAKEISALCVVCAEPIIEIKDRMKSPCGHQFHEGCFEEHVSTSKECPVCHFPLILLEDITNQCVVCFEPFTENSEKMRNKCGHKFHVHCHEECVIDRKRCPICSYPLSPLDNTINKCTVCLSLFDEASKKTLGVCGHKIHSQCKNNLCSICVYPISPWNEMASKCVVCFKSFGKSLEIFTNTCGHRLHNNCYDAWLINHKKCPICKYPLHPWDDVTKKCVSCLKTFSEFDVKLKGTCQHKFHQTCCMHLTKCRFCQICEVFIKITPDAPKNECSVCLEPFVDSTDMTKTSCDHEFHRQCLTKWLRRFKTCPNCRHAL